MNNKKTFEKRGSGKFSKFHSKPKFGQRSGSASSFGQKSESSFGSKTESGFAKRSGFKKRPSSGFGQKSGFGQRSGSASSFGKKPGPRFEKRVEPSFSQKSESSFGSKTESGFAKRSGFKKRPSSGFGQRSGSGFGQKRRSFGKRGGGGRSERIDFSKFVNKATEPVQSDVFTPEHKFSDFEINPKLKEAIALRNFEYPTPIQDKTIPEILKGKDVVGIANTGTGKTGAFLVPLINKIILNPREQALIMVPTRELAIQIEDELRAFTKNMKIHSVVCVGGMSIGKQIGQLRYHNNFVIGTPGRLKDLINRKRLDFSTFKSVVLDEADRMLDMGFIQDMKYIMGLMPKERQTLFFSATLSPDIEKLIGDFLTNPVSISVKKRDTAKNIDQDVIRIEKGSNKIDVLHNLLIQEEFQKVLVFGRTKHGVEGIYKDLSKRGLKVESIHGDKNHAKRQRALISFKENKVQVLVATDVAARGLDIPNVSHVINFDIPETYTDYVHRIGRTGRGNNTGKALTFIM